MTAEMVRAAVAKMDEFLTPGRRYLVVNSTDVAAAQQAAAEVGNLTVAHSPAARPMKVIIVDGAGLAHLRERIPVEVVP